MSKLLRLSVLLSLIISLALLCGCKSVPCGEVVFEKTKDGWQMKEVIAPFFGNEGGITPKTVKEYEDLLNKTIPVK